jgi:hypothetical protein
MLVRFKKEFWFSGLIFIKFSYVTVYLNSSNGNSADMQTEWQMDGRNSSLISLQSKGRLVCWFNETYLVLENNQLDAQLFSYIFIPILYMFRTPLCSSSGESIVLIRYPAYVALKTSEWTKITKVYLKVSGVYFQQRTAGF